MPGRRCGGVLVRASRTMVIRTVAEAPALGRPGEVPEPNVETDADLEGCTAAVTDVDRAVAPEATSAHGASRVRAFRGSLRPAGRRS
jgi:hypothetical protein